jgi:hypothetical protein
MICHSQSSFIHRCNHPLSFRIFKSIISPTITFDLTQKTEFHGGSKTWMKCEGPDLEWGIGAEECPNRMLLSPTAARLLPDRFRPEPGFCLPDAPGSLGNEQVHHSFELPQP